MHCGNFGSWLICYWLFLGGGKPNAQTELEVVCFGGGYHLEKQVGVVFEVLQKTPEKEN